MFQNKRSSWPFASLPIENKSALKPFLDSRRNHIFRAREKYFMGEKQKQLKILHIWGENKPATVCVTSYWEEKRSKAIIVRVNKSYFCCSQISFQKIYFRWQWWGALIFDWKRHRALLWFASSCHRWREKDLTKQWYFSSQRII